MKQLIYERTCSSIRKSFIFYSKWTKKIKRHPWQDCCTEWRVSDGVYSVGFSQKFTSTKYYLLSKTWNKCATESDVSLFTLKYIDFLYGSYLLKITKWHFDGAFFVFVLIFIYLFDGQHSSSIYLKCNVKSSN